jgi:hypothetical protein
MNANAQQRQGNHIYLPQIVVHPKEACVFWPCEARIQGWLDYCHPVSSVADDLGIRHYLYGHAGCEFGLSAP